MAINKVEANGETLIDLTNDTVRASDVLKGKTLHLASGMRVEGTYDHDSKQDTFVDLWEAEVGSEGVNELDIDELSDFIDNYSALIVMLSNENDDSETVGLACTLASAYCDLTYAFKHGNAAISAMISLQPNMEFPSVRTVFSWIYMDQSPYESTPRHIYVIATRDSSVPPSLLTGLYLRKIVGIPISGWKLAVLSGYMPLTFPSNGDDLLNYRIYGTADGAGVQTENLFNKNATDTANGYVDGEHLVSNGATNSNSLWAITEYIPITGEHNYTFNYGTLSSSPAICYYDSNKQFVQGIRYGGQSPKVVSISSGVSYIRFSFMKSYADAIMFVQAISLPSAYIPYGYKLPLTVTNSTETKTTDIYIGDSKLGEEEYVDYGEQKIYRRILFMTHDDKHFITKDNKDFCLRRRGYSG